MGEGVPGEADETIHNPKYPSVLRALCPNCDVVDVGVADARLVIEDWIDEATCRFMCPQCATPLEKPVAPPLVQVLIQMGVPYDYPGGMASKPPPPLCAADLEQFLRDLSTFEG